MAQKKVTALSLIHISAVTAKAKEFVEAVAAARK